MNVERGVDFEACFDSGVSGFVNIVSLMLVDNDGAVFWPASTADIVETPAGSGIYCANRTAPIVIGQYTIVWSLDGTYDPATVGIENLRVTSVSTTFPPLPEGDLESGAVAGPCSAWTTVTDVAACCNAEDVVDNAVYQDAVDSASRLLWELSGRLYAGTCEDTARPCQTQCGCFGQVLSRGHLVNWDGCSWGTSYCGCSPLSRVLLSGYPLREILEVKISGAIVDPTTYRLDERRYLTRVRPSDTDDPLYWPACQSLDLPDTENGTWSVTYTHGQNPPSSGQTAAAQLACEIYKSCTGAECALPSGATRVTRQGITIERQFFRRDPITKAWRTGLSSVDLFLNSVNPDNLRRRPAIWGPGMQRFARRVGV